MDILNRHFGITAIPTDDIICLLFMVIGIEHGDGIGNFSMLAGSINPSTSNYQGGDILLDSNIYIYGNVLAGDQYTNNSNVYINGLIGAEGNMSSDGHTVVSDITVDMRNLPSTFVPVSTIPSPGAAGTDDVDVFWTRYL